MLRLFQYIIIALSVAQVSNGHSWVGSMRNIDDDGNYIGKPGFARGYIQQGDVGFTSDEDRTNRVPITTDGALIKENTLLCGPRQRQAKQTFEDKYPRLQATPGGFMALRYTENGHVTIPAPNLGKPSPEEGSGTVFIYGTTEPKEDEKIVNIMNWTKDGKGGDKRGVLLSAQDFNDGRCYQINETPKSNELKAATPDWVQGQENQGEAELPCESDLMLPETAEIGKPYTLYWVWQWPTYPDIDPGLPKGKDEYYTSCIDVDVVAKDAAHVKVDASKLQHDTMSKAVEGWKSRKAQQPDVQKGEMGPMRDKLPSGDSMAGPGPDSGSSDNSDNSSNSSIASPAPPAATPSPQASASSPPAQTVTPITLQTSGGPAIPTLTGRPGSAQPPKPSPQPSSLSGDASGSDDMVTITDTVLLTVTADPAAKSSAVSSQRLVSSVTAPSAQVSPPVSSVAASSARISPPSTQLKSRTAQSTTLMTLKSSQRAAASPAPSGALGGFNMDNTNGAKFRRGKFA